MVGFDGTGLDEYLKFLIGQVKAGGLILFAVNLENPDQIKDLCLEVQEYARQCGQPPLFIAIDQEGGPVARLKAFLLKRGYERVSVVFLQVPAPPTGEG